MFGTTIPNSTSSIIMFNESEPSSSLQGSQPCRHFEFSEIQLATENFDDSLVIGHGGFGKVYKGNVINGSSLVGAAIKRLDSMSNQGAAEFWAEVEVLSKLRHCHLVSLIGYCNHEKEMILVYEYMPHGTLEDHLHKRRTPLSWLERLKICKGAARGLDYLHTGTGIEQGVIHRDVKSSNILLHETWAAKIADFGLSIIGPTNQPSTYVNTRVKGTFGYLDPNYYSTGRLTRKSDVYAFGVVLFEVLCRKRAVDRSLDEEQWGLAPWAQDSIKEGRLKHILDPEIRGQISPKCLKEFVRIAERCLHSHPKQRPTMAEVVVTLESVQTLQEKTNDSLQPVGRTIFGRMLDMFPVPSNGDNSAHGDSKLSSNSKGNNKSPILWKRKKKESREDEAELNIEFEMGTGPKRFSYHELARATGDFAENQKLGEGGFGGVYRGFFKDSCTYVAVKRVSKSSKQGIKEYASEVRIISRLRHRNLVQLTGWCHEKGELLLVYEFMENGSLDSHLYKAKSLLTWGTRYKIAHGVASALLYLHEECEQCVLHRDIKPSNVMLDSNFNAKIGDFGLAKLVDHEKGSLTTMLAGTIGYMAPELVMTCRPSKESDVYSFGVVALEMACGRKPIEYKAQENAIILVEWVWKLYGTGALLEAADPRLGMNFEEEEIKRLMILGLWCAHPNSAVRPSMRQAIQVLNSEASLPILPPGSYFSPSIVQNQSFSSDYVIDSKMPVASSSSDYDTDS